MKNLPSNCLIDQANQVVGLNCIPTIFSNIVFWLLALVGITAVFLIIFAGIKFLTSGGDPKQVEGARKTLTYAIIGLVIVLLAAAIIKLISIVTGVDCLQFFGLNNCQ